MGQVRFTPDDAQPSSTTVRFTPDDSVTDQSSQPNFLSAIQQYASPNMLANPLAGINMAMNNFSPTSVAKQIAPTAGKLAMLANPELMSGSGLIPGTVNALGRIGLGTAATTAQQANSLNSSTDLGNALQKNAIGNTAIEGLPLVAQGIGKSASYFQPQKYSEQILNGITGGQTVADNARIFANKIQQSYNNVKNIGGQLYARVSHDPYVNSIDSIHSGMDSQYEKVVPDVEDDYTKALKNYHNTFEQDPTFNNAHNLQSQLGYEIRDLQKQNAGSGLDKAGKDQLYSYQNARNALLKDMNDSLSPSLQQDYKNANDYWFDRVVPYTSNSKLNTIVNTDSSKLKGKDIQNISDIFKNPNEDIQQIASDIGPDVNNHILSDKLGPLTNKVDPNKLQNAISDLKNKGFDKYIPPEIENQMQKLSNIGLASKGMKALPGVGLGYYVGSKLGVPAELAMGALGGVASPIGMNFLNKINPYQAIPETARNALLQSYRPVARGILAN